LSGEYVQFIQETQHHQSISERIDAARDSPSMSMQRFGRTLFEGGIAVPADLLQPMFQIVAAFGDAERSKVIGGNDALAQLFEIVAGDNTAELRLSNKKALKWGCIADLD